MRYAVVSDIHANWQAWKAVSRDIDQVGVDAVLCLGDIVGYGPDPARVLEAVYSRAENFVLGNHDAVICNKIDSDIFNDEPKFIIEWTRQQLNPAAEQFFGDLPMSLVGENFLLTHAEVAFPDRFDYIYEPQEAVEHFEACEEQLIFVGHTHFPCNITYDEEKHADYKPPEDFYLEAGMRNLVNVGSVGDPRNGDVDSQYVIFDQEKGHINFRKVPFNTSAYRDALARSGLPTKPLLFDYLDQKDLLPTKEAARGQAIHDHGKITVKSSAASSPKKKIKIVRRPAGGMQFGAEAGQVQLLPKKTAPSLPMILGIIALLVAMSGGLFMMLNQGKGSGTIEPGTRSEASGLQWNFEEGNGESATTLEHAVKLKLHGATWDSGKAGSALALTSRAAYVAAPNPQLMALSASKPFSINFWIQPDEDGDILSKRDSNNNGPGYNFRLEQSRVRVSLIHSEGDNAIDVITRKRLPAPADAANAVNLQEGLVLHLPFDGDLKEQISGTTGTTEGGTFAGGHAGQALQLSDQQTVRLDKTLGTMPAFTWAAWLNVNKKLNGHGDFFIAGDDLFVLLHADKPRLYVSNSKHTRGADPGTEAAKIDLVPFHGQWMHLAIAYNFDEKHSVFYINGEEKARLTGSTSATAKFAGPITLENFDGAIDELRIYRRELNAAEVKSLHDGESAPTGPGAWAHVSVNYPGTGNAQDLVIAVNGVPQELDIRQNALSGELLNNSAFKIGSDFTRKNGFLGRLDEFRYYNRALSAADALALSSGREPGSVTEVVAIKPEPPIPSPPVAPEVALQAAVKTRLDGIAAALSTKMVDHENIMKEFASIRTDLGTNTVLLARLQDLSTQVQTDRLRALDESRETLNRSVEDLAKSKKFDEAIALASRNTGPFAEELKPLRKSLLADLATRKEAAAEELAGARVEQELRAMVRQIGYDMADYLFRIREGNMAPQVKEHFGDLVSEWPNLESQKEFVSLRDQMNNLVQYLALPPTRRSEVSLKPDEQAILQGLGLLGEKRPDAAVKLLEGRGKGSLNKGLIQQVQQRMEGAKERSAASRMAKIKKILAIPPDAEDATSIYDGLMARRLTPSQMLAARADLAAYEKDYHQTDYGKAQSEMVKILKNVAAPRIIKHQRGAVYALPMHPAFIMTRGKQVQVIDNVRQAHWLVHGKADTELKEPLGLMMKFDGKTWLEAPGGLKNSEKPELTMCFWTLLKDGSHQVMVQLYSPFKRKYGLFMLYLNGNQWHLAHSATHNNPKDPAPAKHVRMDTAFKANVPQYHVVTLDREGLVRWFIDGEETKKRNQKIVPDILSSMIIGAEQDIKDPKKPKHHHFKGSMMDFQLYNRVFKDEEIKGISGKAKSFK